MFLLILRSLFIIHGIFYIDTLYRKHEMNKIKWTSYREGNFWAGYFRISKYFDKSQQMFILMFTLILVPMQSWRKNIPLSTSFILSKEATKVVKKRFLFRLCLLIKYFSLFPSSRTYERHVKIYKKCFLSGMCLLCSEIRRSYIHSNLFWDEILGHPFNKRLESFAHIHSPLF